MLSDGEIENWVLRKRIKMCRRWEFDTFFITGSWDPCVVMQIRRKTSSFLSIVKKAIFWWWPWEILTRRCTVTYQIIRTSKKLLRLFLIERSSIKSHSIAKNICIPVYCKKSHMYFDKDHERHCCNVALWSTKLSKMTEFFLSEVQK